jgi:excisionase family DNA binding protein
MRSFLITQEVADIYRVRGTTVLAWIKQGKLPAIKRGRKYLFDKEALETFDGVLLNDGHSS